MPLGPEVDALVALAATAAIVVTLIGYEAIRFSAHATRSATRASRRHR